MESVLPSPAPKGGKPIRRVLIAVVDLPDGGDGAPIVRSGHMIAADDPGTVQELLQGLLDRPACLPMNPEVERVELQVVRRSELRDIRLSPRERQVLQALVAGLSYKMIADRLGIGFQTVSTHLRHIYAKLGVRTNTEAVAMALRCNMLARCA
ncbi:MAG: hypothetical protein IT228_10180 [Flavobacteriales bacterium]|nr:hypothetical protein [Flavobacteriales bacterium]MCC6577696.1 hypothetical protein [Flavobacteriales bacterium]NUQ15067.1 hypothetical protein [Flavobacteriales bacterium]